jgi:hypothetical protein
MPRQITATIGANTGAGWPARLLAMNQAMPAATAHWPMCQALLFTRSQRARTDSRLRSHAASMMASRLRSRALGWLMP